MCEEHLPALPMIRSGSLSMPIKEPYFWMKSVTCHSQAKPSCSECFKIKKSREWDRPCFGRWTFALLLRPTGTCAL